MSLSENALKAYSRLYLAETFGETTPTEVHERVAKFAAQEEGSDKEHWEAVFSSMMEDNVFRPNSPTLMNAGVVAKPQTSACFVGALDDSLIDIFNFDREAGLVYAQGSGIGGNYGTLREIDGALSTGGASSGPFAFMKKLAATAEAVKSGGRTRRAAHMAMMFDHHPNIEAFITLKDGNDQTYSSMNLSVAASDAFMKAVEEDGDWELKRVVDGSVAKTIKARDLYQKIVENAHKCGDPGFWFIDAANRDNTLMASFGEIDSTNPCGEQALLPRQSCALASINVVSCLDTHDNEMDWDKLRSAVKYAIRFLDNCVDISGFPTEKYREMAVNTRPLGLGIMGFADALILMGIPYDSKEGFAFGEELSRKLTKFALEASLDLAKEKAAFPLWEDNKEGTLKVVKRFLDLETEEDLELFNQIKEHGLRNSQWTTIAPTGTTSIACDCSQGMEPLFAICYDKQLSDTNETWTFAHPIFERLYSNEPWYDEALTKIVENKGSCNGTDCVPEYVQGLFRSAHDIEWEDRISMQAALQKGISNSISSTINLPHDAKVETIGEIYMTAWKKGCKGLTVYRDGSLDIQPVSFGKATQDTESTESPDVRKRPKMLEGKTFLIQTGHGPVYFTINMDEAGNVREVFTNGAKNGSVNAANLEAIGRLISIAMQEGADVEKLAKTIENINDGTAVWERLDESDVKPVKITSIPDALGKILRRFYCKKDLNASLLTVGDTGRCDTCNSPTFMHDGCEFCPECGSKCG